MTQEDKELLLKDLCTRLPYGTKVSVNQSQLQNYDYKWKNWSFDEEPQEIDGVSIYGVTFGCMDMSDGVISFEFIKPYLFPISSMTEGQKIECFKGTPLEIDKYGDIAVKDDFYGNSQYTDLEIYLEVIDWLNAHHFDYRGLIEKGLAIDATGLNIY